MREVGNKTTHRPTKQRAILLSSDLVRSTKEALDPRFIMSNEPFHWAPGNWLSRARFMGRSVPTWHEIMKRWSCPSQSLISNSQSCRTFATPKIVSIQGKRQAGRPSVTMVGTLTVVYFESVVSNKIAGRSFNVGYNKCLESVPVWGRKLHSLFCFVHALLQVSDHESGKRAWCWWIRIDVVDFIPAMQAFPEETYCIWSEAYWYLIISHRITILIYHNVKLLWSPSDQCHVYY